MFCDNQEVVLGSSVPDSMLKKKHVSVCYHRVRESVSAGTIRVYKEASESNLADLFTKPLGPVARKNLLGCIFG